MMGGLRQNAVQCSCNNKFSFSFSANAVITVTLFEWSYYAKAIDARVKIVLLRIHAERSRDLFAG